MNILNIFQNIWQWLNDVVSKLNFDGLLNDLIESYVNPLPEVFKWLFAILLSIIVILGTISFIKKTLKLFIVLIIIAAVILFIYKR